MSVSSTRIQQDLAAFAAIGRTPDGPGITRLAFTAADADARRHAIGLMRAAGLSVRLDAAGNLFGLTPAALAHPEQTVLMGSHLDTVPSGGAYDGATGVVAALEVVRSLAAEAGAAPGAGGPDHQPDAAAAAALPPLGVAVFACEESSRFRVATVGSKVLTGVLSLEQTLALTDGDGVAYADALAAHDNRDEVGSVGPAPAFGAYLELHVEQGRELEVRGQRVAAVERVAAPTRLRIILEGEAAHSGATPLYRRKDALVAAAEVILAVERVAETEAEHGTVGTTTLFTVAPVAINVVPGTVTLGVDVRGVDAASKERCLQKLRDFLRRLEVMREVRIRFEVLAQEDPVALSPAVVAAVLQACVELNLPPLRLDSRAGHDAMYLQRVCPAGMIFIPSAGGISHHPDEYTAPEDIALGTAVLRRAALALAAGLCDGAAGLRDAAAGGGNGASPGPEKEAHP